MPEADIQYTPKGNALEEQQRLMRLHQLKGNKQVMKAWKTYRKTIGKKSMHMPIDMWLDFNYPDGDSAPVVDSRFRNQHREV